MGVARFWGHGRGSSRLDDSIDHLVIGGGAAGVSAVETLRMEGARGRIVLLSAEPGLPYYRPALSKGYIAGESQALPRPILSAERYLELGVELLTGIAARALDTEQRLVHAPPHGPMRYRTLLLATGAAPTELAIPGADLARVHYLRTLADAERIRVSARLSKRAVVIGGSFLGLEIAAALRHWGLAVTLIERTVVMESLHNPELSEFFTRRLEARGLKVVLGDSPTAFLGDGAVEAVRTRQGRTEPCDMVVIGAGVSPATAFLQRSGIKLADGIVVDRFLQTNRPGIFAAGDVASFFDPVFNCQRRVEHWDHAVRQGRIAARNMLGQKLPYDEVSFFFSDVFDLSFNVVGMIGDELDRVDRGSLASGDFASFYLHDAVPRALFSLGRPSDETRVTETLIRHRVRLNPDRTNLRDPKQSLLHIPTQTVLILQGGGAYGAFECGAVRALQESGIRPDIVAGVSIGAFNGAVVAGNPDRAGEALNDFWSDLAVRAVEPPDKALRQWLASIQVAWTGVPALFQPRWLLPALMKEPVPGLWTGFYDLQPALELLGRYVDFRRLGQSPVRLIVSAVDVQTAQLVVFDSYVDTLRAEHIVASGSLPPSFSWTTLEGRHYWDGGIISNSPLEWVLERCGSAGKRVFVVDLFSGKRSGLPTNLSEVMSRRDEIIYSERIRNDMRVRDQIREFRRLVDDLLIDLPAEAANRIRHRPRFIQLMGEEAPMTVTRIVRKSRRNESPSSDFDFSSQSLRALIAEGYRVTREVLAARSSADRP